MAWTLVGLVWSATKHSAKVKLNSQRKTEPSDTPLPTVASHAHNKRAPRMVQEGWLEMYTSPSSGGSLPCRRTKTADVTAGL